MFNGCNSRSLWFLDISKTSAPRACTPFPFFGRQIHNGVWSLVCNCELRSATLEPYLNSFWNQSGMVWGSKMASVSSYMETVSAHSISANQEARLIPKQFPSRASTHWSQRPFGNRSSGLAERIKLKQNMIFWWFPFTLASLSLYKWRSSSS